jgi:1,2-diacylglycerol 3-beta-galactosyltransferase
MYSHYVNYFTRFYGWMWHATNNNEQFTKYKAFVELLLSTAKGRSFMEAYEPDVVVSVNPIFNATLFDSIPKPCPFVLVVTDPVSAHWSWVEPRAEKVFVGTSRARDDYLQRSGHDPNDVLVAGQPISSVYYTAPRPSGAADLASLRTRLGLDPNGPPVVLLTGGGEGCGNLEAICAAFDDASRRGSNDGRLDFQLVVVCGRNTLLETKLRRRYQRYHVFDGEPTNNKNSNTQSTPLSFPDQREVAKEKETPVGSPLRWQPLGSNSLLHRHRQVLGFVTNFVELLDAADCVVSKAGPGTVWEARARRRPIVLHSWIPGQEEGNVEHVRKRGWGVVETCPNLIPAAVMRAIKLNSTLASTADGKQVNETDDGLTQSGEAAVTRIAQFLIARATKQIRSN